MGAPRKKVHRKRVEITLSPLAISMGREIVLETGESFSGLIDRLIQAHKKEIQSKR